jgi:hypothetical protein
LAYKLIYRTSSFYKIKEGNSVRQFLLRLIFGERRVSLLKEEGIYFNLLLWRVSWVSYMHSLNVSGSFSSSLLSSNKIDMFLHSFIASGIVFNLFLLKPSYLMDSLANRVGGIDYSWLSIILRISNFDRYIILSGSVLILFPDRFKPWRLESYRRESGTDSSLL